MDANGVARMVEVEDGFAVAPGETHVLKRGGDHVMLMGLTRPLADGDTFELKLVFEREGEVVLEVPVDLNRAPASGHDSHGGHGAHGMGG
jgi:copper(I)-binding protein